MHLCLYEQIVNSYDGLKSRQYNHIIINLKKIEFKQHKDIKANKKQKNYWDLIQV